MCRFNHRSFHLGFDQKLAKRWDIFYVFKRHTLKRNQARVDKKNLTIRMIFALILAIGMALVAYYVLNMVQVSSIIIMATISVVFILAFIKSPTWAISVLGAAYAAYGLSQELWAGIQHLFPNLTSLQHHAMQALVVISGVAIFLMTFQCIFKMLNKVIATCQTYEMRQTSVLKKVEPTCLGCHS